MWLLSQRLIKLNNYKKAIWKFIRGREFCKSGKSREFFSNKGRRFCRNKRSLNNVLLNQKSKDEGYQTGKRRWKKGKLRMGSC